MAEVNVVVDPVIEEDEDTFAAESDTINGLSAGANELSDDLSKIKITYLPKPIASVKTDDFDPKEFQESYKENLPKENLVLAYAENFRRQYVHLYRDRKPLFVNPINECGTEKLVCTTIRPTLLPYEQLYDWDGASEFVSDYLNFLTLETPYELPTRLLSPTTVLQCQKGNCFEYSTLLCSLLIGAGYDAYVVSGYATKETCLMDETREICPLLKTEIESKTTLTDIDAKKYAVKPPKDLQSKFERKQEERRLQEIKDAQEKLRIESEQIHAELEQPPPDALYGLRIHSWVLVVEGKREVPEAFFIEPFTGIAHPTTSSNYLGIESIWNNVNYWVNMQDCSEGVLKMRYDLGDCILWEYMFPNNEKPLLNLPIEEPDLMDGLDDEEEEEIEDNLDMPQSWVQQIEVSAHDFQMRCPMGKKTKYYKRAKLEKFAHYLMKDGLVCRLSVYRDKEREGEGESTNSVLDLLEVKEFFAHRKDQLYERRINQLTGWVTEYFKPGRTRSLKEHQYKSSAPGPENERAMIFYREARVDGLLKRVETPIEMTEHFVDREDQLYYRHVEFSKRPKKFGPADVNVPRPIVKMIERYHPDLEKAANETIAEIVFNITDDKIQITYHTEHGKISASTREFSKPSNTEEKGLLIMTPDMHTTFQVDPMTPAKKQVDLYNNLVDFLKAEDTCKEYVRLSEEEVQDILNERTRESAMAELDVSVYDTMRNEKAKKHRKELERMHREEKLRKQELELDYLAPFLAQIGNPEKLTRQQAFKLKEDCLADLKQRLIDKANLIQARFEKETQELQKKQAWYQQNQMSMMKDDEEEYLSYCSDAMFRIHILELRLNRHKENAPQKYMALEQDIRSDTRLSEFF